MAEALLAAAPTWRRLLTNFLDADSAWWQVLDHFLALPDGRPDADAIVKWSMQPDAATRYAAVPGPLAEAVGDRLEQTAGALGRLLACAVSAGNVGDLLPIGLACDMVFREEGATPEPALAQAAVRLEPLLGGTGIEPSIGREWAACARRVLRSTPRDQRGEWLDRGERLLTRLKVERWAGLSLVLPSGFSQRLDRFATAADAAIVNQTALATAESAFRRVLEHDACSSAPERVEHLGMAMRLVRGLHLHPPDSTGLAAMMEHHLTEGAFEDCARRHLRGGDEHTGVAALYGTLYRAVRGRREEQNRAFALQVCSWTTAPRESGVVAIEHCLTNAVLPVAKSRPVLVLVLDAMDAGIFEELGQSLRERGWQRHRAVSPAALAVVPTVTQVSRMALFSGEVTQGGGAHEKSAFAEHAALRDVSQRGKPPRLFHKADLVDGDTLGLAAAVREALGNQRQRVVGIVLNVVDDHLAKSEQLRLTWRIDSVGIMPAILHEAHAAGRVVVLTSDHGHVLEAGGVKLTGNVEGRWRTADHPPNELEIQLEGERVRAATGRERIILPWSETVRYGQKKNGYHGGLTLQEAVVPVGIFVGPGDKLPDSKPWPPQYPPWWSGEDPSRKPASRTTPKRRRIETRGESQLEFFT